MDLLKGWGGDKSGFYGVWFLTGRGVIVDVLCYIPELNLSRLSA